MDLSGWGHSRAGRQCLHASDKWHPQGWGLGLARSARISPWHCPATLQEMLLEPELVSSGQLLKPLGLGCGMGGRNWSTGWP